jgi:hypothetical protein
VALVLGAATDILLDERDGFEPPSRSWTEIAIGLLLIFFLRKYLGCYVS